MKTYFKSIAFLQDFFLIMALLVMLVLPLILVFAPGSISETATLHLYAISHFTVFFVMIIRPLADIFTETKFIRPLVILRKGLGVLSASIIVSFIFSKIIIDASGYFGSLITSSYWSLNTFALFAHLGDISAIILLVTSNNFSKRILKTWWKKIQKLSYVYFFSSSIYVLAVFKDQKYLYSMLIVALLLAIAYRKNKTRMLTQKIV